MELLCDMRSLGVGLISVVWLIVSVVLFISHMHA